HMLGVVVFGKDSHVTAYEMLRGQISSALNTVAMHREIVRQTAIHERTVQERAATAERMKSLSVLAGGVAHDLNNALGPLVALPDIILQEIEELARNRVPVDSEVYSDLKTIKSAALRAAQTIKDLLSLARVGRVNKEHLDLNQVIASCLSAPAHRPLVGQQRDVRLIYEQSPEALFVEASEPHVVRAAMNLVHNAVESIEGFGTVTIRTYRQRLTQALSGYETIEPGDYAVVTVSDTGHGITPDVMRRVFEPFFSNKKAHENSGSGLGLAIVHGVIKEHHGFVNVESEPGRGTSFSLYFPLVERPASTERNRPPSVKPGNARILVVDDDPVQLRTARRILTRLGYDVTTTDSGSKAYALFEDRSSPRAAGSGAERSSPFDLVVMDMILQEADDGLRVLERIQALYPQQCAILVSGHAPMERGMLAVQRGIGWLGKPYTLEALGLAVQSALSPKQTTPPARSERSTPSLLVPRARLWKLSRAR
ncbi:MAG TPA: ATP-binding protein, partial [Polyangiaceae bacterium]